AVNRARREDVVFGEELGDAEIQQLRVPVGRQEDVLGLEVAMHDEIAMRVADGLADLEEELDARPERGSVLAKVGVERLAVDVLENEVRVTAVAHAAVDETGDPGVIEAREDRALAVETRLELRRRGEELDRDALRERPVDALGEIHGAHAARS